MSKAEETVAALDPGRDKCGLAVLSGTGEILYQQVIPTGTLEQILQEQVERHHPSCLLLGNGTTGKEAKERIQRSLPHLALEVVDEYRTTEMAKKEYWKMNPPKGWRRLLPLGMQVPPVPVDDFVAVILARRYLDNEGEP